MGVNRFQKDEERVVPTFRLDPALEASQVERVREVRAGRSQSAVAEKLAALERAARGDRQSDAADSGCRRGVCHGRRNFGLAARRFRRASRSLVGSELQK